MTLAPRATKMLAVSPSGRPSARGLAVLLSLIVFSHPGAAHAQNDLTPLQREIQRESARLSSSGTEERRDAVMRLGAMGRPEAARAALPALGDASAVVRAQAARAVVTLGPAEASTRIVPLLRDRDEFVRREAAYALGLTRSPVGVAALVGVLQTDKKPEVRGAAAVALGQIGDPSATLPLAGALSRRLRAPGVLNRVLRRNTDEDEFVRRSAAVALGQLGSREGVRALIDALSDQKAPPDVRRESARALGIIGEASAAPALRAALAARDPYLSQIAFEALRRIDPASATRPL